MQTWDMIGYAWAVQQLQRALEASALSHALLITGAEGVGKRTLALALARALLCQAPKATARPCNTCSACRRVSSNNHPDLRLLEPDATSRGVKIEQVREMGNFLALTPNESAHKIAIIPALELMNPNAGNALLKTLEEPPPYAHLILLATDADTLLPTIVSRSQQITLRLLDVDTVARGLIERWGATEAEAFRLARLSGGRVGWAVQALTDPTHLQQMETAFEQLFAALKADLPTRFELAQTLAQDTALLARTLEYWRLGWRDIMLLQTANIEQLMFSEKRALLEDLAARLDLASSARLLRALTTAQGDLLRNVNTRLLLETLFLDWPEL